MSDKPKLCLIHPSGGKGCISLGCEPRIIHLWINRQLGYHGIKPENKALQEQVEQQQETIERLREALKRISTMSKDYVGCGAKNSFYPASKKIADKALLQEQGSDKDAS